MSLKDISVVKASISIDVGNNIVDNKCYNYKVVYIDFIYDMVVLVTPNGNTDVLSFLDIAENFKRV